VRAAQFLVLAAKARALMRAAITSTYEDITSLWPRPFCGTAFC
jgi:hypothetical protein